jgi:coenzyme F420-reducing hydrogenase beta subunit
MVSLPKNCNGCGTCYLRCPKNAIKFKPNIEGFTYPVINNGICIKCGLCTMLCPINNCPSGKDEIPEAYGCFINDNYIHLQSSSGGIFSAIAERIILVGGVVFGAKFNDEFEVIHGYAETIEELSAFRGSKYVQSNSYEMFEQTEKFLASGRKVLFTGTPCQIGGLKAYLNKDYENLYLQDVICHGVPSPKVWEKYVEYRERVSGSKIQRIAFRVKPWKRFSVLFSFENNTEYRREFPDDDFMKLFLHNVDLRNSCYNCAFKSINRLADITLADFWGIETVLPELDTDDGVSLIFIHSVKGRLLLESVNDLITKKSVNAKEAVIGNSAALYSVRKHPNRDKLFERLIWNNDFDFEELTKCMLKMPLTYKVKSFIIRAVPKPLRTMVKKVLKSSQ